MNIDQYRAIKAQQETGTQTPQQVEQTQPVVETAPPVVETKQEEKVDKPFSVNINGEEVTLEELEKGYLRQSDYTRKTQEIANQKKELGEAVSLYETLKQNPQTIETIKSTIKVPQTLDPVQAKVVELEQKVFDMMLEQEINRLQVKYPDFEVMEVLDIAKDKGLTNLEDAYKLTKVNKTTNTSIDVDKLKEQIRKEVQEELKATSTVISNNGYVAKAVTINTPTLTEGEMKIAKGFGMTAEEYVKWKSKTIKK